MVGPSSKQTGEVPIGEAQVRRLAAVFTWAVYPAAIMGLVIAALAARPGTSAAFSGNANVLFAALLAVAVVDGALALALPSWIQRGNISPASAVRRVIIGTAIGLGIGVYGLAYVLITGDRQRALVFLAIAIALWPFLIVRSNQVVALLEKPGPSAPCPRCGAIPEPGAVICPRCGAEL